MTAIAIEGRLIADAMISVDSPSYTIDIVVSSANRALFEGGLMIQWCLHGSSFDKHGKHARLDLGRSFRHTCIYIN